MDPVTAFSLVCGVIQVVDFGTKVIVKCRRLYEEGSLEEYEDMEDIAKHLVDVREDLNQRGDAAHGMLSPSDKRLSIIARECSTTSTELLAKIQSLKILGSPSKRETLRKVVKSYSEKKEMAALEKKLDGYRQALDTQILITLSQRSDLASFQQLPQFKSLDEKVQQLVASLADGQTKLEVLGDLTQKESGRTRQHIDDALQHQNEQSELKEYQKQLLDSLCFKEIFSREERIADAHRKTFEWVFSKSDQAVRPWDNFVRWLETGEGTYWINGKAGSGKSTLMSFLCRDNRTQASLEVWSGTKMILTPQFYFWAGGTFLQKSIEGLLRSLIWQILTALADSQISEYTHLLSPSPSNHRVLAAWTERRLRSTLRGITEKVSKSYRVCFFIDGLDEFVGDQDDLIECIQHITECTEVKTCLSSRSYNAFEQVFGGYARLRLQDLTRNDIGIYVTDKFQASIQPSLTVSSRLISLENIIDKILDRAEGVFLWVSFAVKDQLLGLRNGDSQAQLEERIELLPSDVEGIYADMLKKIEKPYLKEAAIYLNIVLEPGLPLRILRDLAIMTYGRIDDILTSPCPLPKKDMIAFSESRRGRIMTTCKGLLDVRRGLNQSNRIGDLESCLDCESGESGGSIAETAVDQSKAVLGSHVDFMHRTTADFIQNSAQGKEFLLANTPKTFQCEDYSIRGALYACRQIGDPGANHEELDYWINFVMDSVRDMEMRTGRVHEDLCDLIDLTFSRVFDREEYTNGLPRPHWIWHYSHIRGLLKPLSAGDKELDLDFSNESSNTPSSWQNSNDAMFFGRSGFICLASLSGLLHYVKRCLDSRTSLAQHHQITHLLFCAAYGIIVKERIIYPDRTMTSYLSLLSHLLDFGADPNSKVCSIRYKGLLLQRPTIWLIFLFSNGMANAASAFFNIEMANALQKSRSDCISSFISNGADLNAIAQIWIQVSNFPFGPDRWIYYFAISLSVLTISEIFLIDEFEMPDFHNDFIAKGARRFARCWKIKAKKWPRRWGLAACDVTSDAEMVLSESESADFFATHPSLLRKLLNHIVKDKGTTLLLWEFAETLRSRRCARFPALKD